MTFAYHIPVLVEAVVEGLITDPSGIYVDATFGGGGHSRTILARLSSQGRLYAIDKDPDAPLSKVRDTRFTGIRGDFRHIRVHLEKEEVRKVHGILADLGVSSHQVDVGERGFSYRVEAPLDLRMDYTRGEPGHLWLGKQHPSKLAELLRMYGDLPKSRRLAEEILRRWHIGFTTGELLLCARRVYGRYSDAYLAPLFQALRIAINDEMGALEALLEAAGELIMPGGRLVLLTYHSGEVKRVKAALRQPQHEDPVTGQRTFRWKLLHKHTPSAEEIQQNPRSRSAILWIAERL